MAERVLQVSDCHLSADPGADYRGTNADRNLQRLAPAVRAFGPDLLVLTGDLSEDASPGSYRRIADWALQFSCPVAWLPGNHDDRSIMEPLFESQGFSAGPRVPLPGWQLVLLDSARVDDPAGTLDDERLARLDDAPDTIRTGVFVHHQPVPVGAAWIDRVGLRNPERLWTRLAERSGVEFIAFGHVHQRFRATRQGIECLACPSTAANSLAGRPKFTPGETTPMARWFVLEPNGWRSGLIGVNDS